VPRHLTLGLSTPDTCACRPEGEGPEPTAFKAHPSPTPTRLARLSIRAAAPAPVHRFDTIGFGRLRSEEGGCSACWPPVGEARRPCIPPAPALLLLRPRTKQRVRPQSRQDVHAVRRAVVAPPQSPNQPVEKEKKGAGTQRASQVGEATPRDRSPAPHSGFPTLSADPPPGGHVQKSDYRHGHRSPTLPVGRSKCPTDGFGRAPRAGPRAHETRARYL
jgi:hypothetical protein